MHRLHPEPGDLALERQAHRFANAFLIPAARLAEEWPRGRIDWTELMVLKQRWHISLAALLYRARTDGLIGETAYESATRYMSRAGWKTTEPGNLGMPERPRLLRRAVDALEQAGIDLPHLAEEARVPERLVRTYLQLPEASSRVSVVI